MQNTVIKILLFFILTSTPVLTVETEKANVIVVVLDGVRWQDFFTTSESKTRFKRLFKKYGKQAVTGGNLEQGEPFVTAAPPKSLPVYRAFFTGQITDCFDNNCGRVNQRTFLEKLLDEEDFAYHEVAVISSWNKIGYAAASQGGAVAVNTGLSPFTLPDNRSAAWLKKLNRKQFRYRPRWPSARYDHFTGEFALKYLKIYRPRFMFLAFNDADEWAHHHQKIQYYRSLERYDRYLAKLFKTLGRLKQYGKNTNIIITTDHGRSGGDDWFHHGAAYPESRFAWFFATGPDIENNRSFIKEHITSIIELHTLVDLILDPPEEEVEDAVETRYWATAMSFLRPAMHLVLHTLF